MDKIYQSDSKTETLILQAAIKVFVKKGYEGASMRQIADLAGINKSLLHYYFRSKEKLFGIAFQSVFREFFPKVYDMLVSDESLFNKIQFFVETYIDMLIQNKHVPAFIIQELNRNPEIVFSLIGQISYNADLAMKKINEQIREEVSNGIIKPIKAENLLTNMIALCLFPFIAKPILSFIIFNKDEEKYQDFISARKAHVINFLISSIRK